MSEEGPSCGAGDRRFTLLDFLFKVLWDSHEGRDRGGGGGGGMSPARKGKPTTLATPFCVGRPCCRAPNNPTTFQHTYFSAPRIYL